jgi:hypothetical protein
MKTDRPTAPASRPDPAAIQTQIDKLVKPLEGWQWAYKNAEGGFATIEKIRHTIATQCDKFGGLAYLLDRVCEESDLSVEKAEALLFARDVLLEEKKKINSIWPHRSEDGACFVPPESLAD